MLIVCLVKEVAVTSLVSILLLVVLTAILSNLDRITWPPQHSGLYSNDPDYLVAVQRDAAAYLAIHTNASAETRRSVEAMRLAASQRLEGMTR